MENEFGYYSKDVALELDITTSTLRRWSIELEKEGYKFHRNEKEQRIYFERDFKAFREFKKLTSNSVPLSDAIKAVVAMDFEKKNGELTPSVQTDVIRLTKRELQSIIKSALEEERDQFIEIMQEKWNDSLEKRDRLLMQQLKHSMEQRQQQIEMEKEQNKKVWWKIFSK